MTESEVKEKLSHLLSQEYLDYSAILSLSSELIKFDKDNVRFSVDAGVIDRLGSELVAKQETAVSELIKNAYDADGEEGVKILSEIIEADNKVVSFSGYRYAFAGGTNANTIDSAVVRSMTAKKNSRPTSESSALNFEAKKGDTKVFFAYPSAWTGTPYFEMFGLAWAQNTDIVAKDNIQVADARGTVEGVLQGPVAYKLYCWELDTPLQAESTKFRVWFK